METTLNLLPPKQKHSLRTALAMAFVQSLAVLVTVAILFVAGTLVALRVILTQGVDKLAEQSTASSGEHKALTQQMRGINDYIGRADSAHGRFVDWSAVLESLGHSAPSGIKFEGISIAPDMTLTVEGTAKTRDDVLAMESQLNSYAHFTNVTSPLSNILKQENLRFEFQMKYVPITE
ncbi:MAG: PilN domain-containing protein [Patescibacteria group bacterium]